MKTLIRVLLLTLLVCLPVLPALADAPVLTFSEPSGFYASEISLEITCDDPKATIYYTLDGSMPDEKSTVYAGPLSLTDSSQRVDVLVRETGINSAEDYIPTTDFPTGRVVSAVAVNKKGEASAVLSGTYFIGYDRKALYGDTAIVCLVTDADNLFDPETGIYVLGNIFERWAAQQTEPFEDWEAQGNFTQHGKEWERPVSVTFMSANGDVHTQNMGMRIKGGASRGYHQKSIRLIARSEYGDKNVNFAIYPDEICEADGELLAKYKSVTLRSGANDVQFAKIRDPYITNLSKGLRFETAANMPAIAFINGEFWGMYTLNEEYTDKYIQYHYGIDDKNVIMVKTSELEEGEEGDFDRFLEMYEFIAWEDMEDPEVYAQACEILDMGAFADYCAMQFFIVNEDGPFHNNNWEMWCVREPDPSVHPYADGKWRMMLYDTDYSSGVYVNGGNFDLDNISPVLYGEDYEEYNPALMLQNLMLSEEFRLELIRACCDVSNLYFSAARSEQILDEMRAQYEPYVPDTLRRFGPQWVTWHPESHYDSHLDNLERFFQKRASTFPDIVKTAFDLENPVAVNIRIENRDKGAVYINGRDIEVKNNDRLRLFAETGVTVTAVPAEGATFKGWSVSHDSAVIADPAALTTEVSFSRMITLTATFD
ncbi:MAG: CotH kinase family protein [Clostridia bacterium]|nr:CotH kinase family protein [Clostridia bacterium]